MVILVADKLERQWLWEVCFGIELDKVIQEVTAQFILQPQYADNFQNVCEGV